MVSTQVAHTADSTHAAVSFRLPRGAGKDLAVRVSAGGTLSDPIAFSYDPPCVRSVYPNPTDATGAVLSIMGYNFGESEASAGAVNVTIGGMPCAPVEVGDTTLAVWRGADEPYLYCETPPSTVGPQTVAIAAAGQVARYAAEDAVVTFHCVTGFYGQTARRPFTTPDGTCLDACDAADAHCARLSLPDATKANCTTITDRDEYCLPCPLGSKCDTYTTAYTRRRRR